MRGGVVGGEVRVGGGMKKRATEWRRNCERKTGHKNNTSLPFQSLPLFISRKEKVTLWSGAQRCNNDRDTLEPWGLAKKKKKEWKAQFQILKIWIVLRANTSRCCCWLLLDTFCSCCCFVPSFTGIVHYIWNIFLSCLSHMLKHGYIFCTSSPTPNPPSPVPHSVICF